MLSRKDWENRVMIDLLIIKANLFRISDTQKRAKIKDEMLNLNNIENGAFAVKDGIIVDIGKTDKLFEKYKDSAKEILDAKGRAVLPGFIDPHTHALFMGTREKEFRMRLEGKSYMDILNAGGGILNSVRKVRQASVEELAAQLEKRVNIFFSMGTTSFEAKSGYGLDFENEIKMLKAIKMVNDTTKAEVIPTFIGAHAIPQEYKSNKEKYIDIIINEMIPYVAQNKLAKFIDVFCEKGVYTKEETKRILTAGLENGLKAKIHSDEIEAIGCSEIAGEIPMISSDHLLKITDRGLEALKKGGTIATLLPGTAFSLKENYAPARKIIDFGIPTAVATDCNPGSSFTESMPSIITLSVMQMNMMPEEAVVSATINAAYAVDIADRAGSLDVGKQADFVILKEDSYLFIPYHYGVNPIQSTYKKGVKVAHSADC